MLKHLGAHLISLLTGYRLSCSSKQANLVTILPAEDLRTVRRKAKMIVFKHPRSIFHSVLRKNLHKSEPQNFQLLPQLNLVQDPETAAGRRELTKTLKKELHSTQALERKPNLLQVRAISSQDVNTLSKRMSTTRESLTVYSSKNLQKILARTRSRRRHGGHDSLVPFQVKVIETLIQLLLLRWIASWSSKTQWSSTLPSRTFCIAVSISHSYSSTSCSSFSSISFSTETVSFQYSRSMLSSGFSDT